MKSMVQRDQAIVAIVGTIVGAALILFSVGLNKLPLLHPKSTYVAEFENSGGLHGGDDVRVAGISVGSVRSVRVAGDHVEVRFTVRKGLALGGGSTATVEVATVLGELFLQVESFGPGRLRPGDVIPIERTTVPYTLLDAFGAFGQTAGDVDLPTLQKSLRELTATLSGISSKELKATLNGLTRLARVVGDRQSEVATLLSDAQKIAATLQKRGTALVHLLDDGDTFVRMLTERRDVIDRLLADTADLGKEVNQLIEKDGAPLTSLLHNIDQISGVLAKNRTQLQAAIKNLSQFSVNIANASGSGPWIDLLLPTLVEPDNVIAACGTQPTPGCGG